MSSGSCWDCEGLSGGARVCPPVVLSARGVVVHRTFFDEECARPIRVRIVIVVSMSRLSKPQHIYVGVRVVIPINI